MKTALLAAVLLLPPAAFAQDQGAVSPDPNAQYQNPRNPVPQGQGTTPFGFGQSRESRFVQEKDKVDAQTGAQPTDRQGADNEVAPLDTPEVQAAPAPEAKPAPAPVPAKKTKKSKKSREQLRKDRRKGAQTVPAAPADKELPAVSQPGKDGSLIDDVPQDVPHD